jgi:hypothetical protein
MIRSDDEIASGFAKETRLTAEQCQSMPDSALRAELRQWLAAKYGRSVIVTRKGIERTKDSADWTDALSRTGSIAEAIRRRYGQYQAVTPDVGAMSMSEYRDYRKSAGIPDLRG